MDGTSGARAELGRLPGDHDRQPGCPALGRGPRGVHPRRHGVTLDDMAEDAVGLIGALGIGLCRVVGFSLGGIITLEA